MIFWQPHKAVGLLAFICSPGTGLWGQLETGGSLELPGQSATLKQQSLGSVRLCSKDTTATTTTKGGDHKSIIRGIQSLLAFTYAHAYTLKCTRTHHAHIGQVYPDTSCTCKQVHPNAPCPYRQQVNLYTRYTHLLENS